MFATKGSLICSRGPLLDMLPYAFCSFGSGAGGLEVARKPEKAQLTDPKVLAMLS